jgi:hypothetical protein
VDGDVLICPSCRGLFPDGFRCRCIVARAATLAAELHEHRRGQVPRWRRPRAWAALPEAVRQRATEYALDLVDLVEVAGWRMVDTRAPGRHEFPAYDQPSTVPHMVRSWS